MLLFSKKLTFAINLVSDGTWLLWVERPWHNTGAVGLSIHDDKRISKSVTLAYFENALCKSGKALECANTLHGLIVLAFRRGDKEFDLDMECKKIEDTEDLSTF